MTHNTVLAGQVAAWRIARRLCPADRAPQPRQPSAHVAPERHRCPWSGPHRRRPRDPRHRLLPARPRVPVPAAPRVSLVHGRCRDVRAWRVPLCSLDADLDSPLDILMNGGTAAPFWNMYTFAQFMYARVRGGRAQSDTLFPGTTAALLLHNVVTALRLRPTSFTQLHYYSQTPFEFRASRRPAALLQVPPAARGSRTGDRHTGRGRPAHAVVSGGEAR